jgi:proteasome lid subunit RPN8/RPN11
VTVFMLPPALRAQLAEAAGAVFPGECCGLVEGYRVDGRIEARALHAARNLASDPDRFEIDPADHVRIQRAARAAGTEIVGCYQSHPAGPPEPSARDRAGALERDFVWLIAGQAGRIGAYIFDGNDFLPLALTAEGSLDPARGLRV